MEMIPKEVFKVLREKLGAGFDDFVLEKIVLIVGDTACENLRIEDSDLRDGLWREVDIIVNTAAAIKFDERYDVALGTNTIGAKNVLHFAKKYLKLQNLVHVSTVSTETLNGTLDLDIVHEHKVVRETLDDLRSQGVTKEFERTAMKELGLQRARQYGWPNTYAFTKAMGEMLIGLLRGDLPVTILRPSIITSTIREPFPGWTEGIRYLIGYGKGKIPCFLADPALVIDLIPGDMVANAMVVASVLHANQPSQYICHVLQLLNAVFCQYWQGLFKDLKGKIKLVLRLGELYEPYIFFEGVFDDSKSEKMRLKLSTRNLEADTFCFDPNCIDWDDYMVNIHLPGVVRHNLK
ncbi:hypothetical protein GIB67_027379 [Kingdonia uniflora]|uniref:Fatty acyl-CoA reductase n=1 Tax=Kingdonia uniflora TaxID=39325 RepID=A0A7J7MFC0_9MAGN|nr:hypothetical protein GIB67_027379 [Kingdonia uniflora]